MNTSIFVPKKINVGYQNRSGTYTGKLAYVIYYDEKGKLRKEASWNSWRDQNIPNEVFDNVPTEGFVLNKKVGDYDSGWNHRYAYCRVYDPRNFEFEITIENLLYILENANSIKGKGLEGEFVYGWDGKDLVLMPVEAPDYKEISAYNKIVHNNESIKAKDLIVGATYLTKDNQERIYMGKFDYYSYGYEYVENGEYKTCKKWSDVPRYRDGYGYSYVKHHSIGYPYGKYFWFACKEYDYNYVNGERVYKDTYRWTFEVHKSVPKNRFITCQDDKCTPEYSEIYESMIRTCIFSPRDYKNTKYVPYTFEEFKKYAEETEERYGHVSHKNSYFIADNYHKYELMHDNETNLWTVRKGYNQQHRLIDEKEDDYYDRFKFKETKGYYSWSSVTKTFIPITIEELYERLKPCYQEIYLENGNLYERNCYYGGKE